ncbi:MAG: MarR family transcriptional regulator [Candidatus Heimdallarchaeota archaeon]|nr:MarR family transcriptional regulator [Candidatus Heimdallarchaeota archaeon]
MKMNSFEEGNNQKDSDYIQRFLYKIDDFFETFTRNRIFLGDEDLSFPEFRVLNFVLDHERSGMKMISEHFSIAPSTTTGIINRLEDRNYVIRVINKEDRRKFLIKISDIGKKKLEVMTERIFLEMQKVFKNFSHDEEMEFFRLLNKLASLFQR